MERLTQLVEQRGGMVIVSAIAEKAGVSEHGVVVGQARMNTPTEGAQREAEPDFIAAQ